MYADVASKYEGTLCDEMVGGKLGERSRGRKCVINTSAMVMKSHVRLKARSGRGHPAMSTMAEAVRTVVASGIPNGKLEGTVQHCGSEGSHLEVAWSRHTGAGERRTRGKLWH